MLPFHWHADEILSRCQSFSPGKVQGWFEVSEYELKKSTGDQSLCFSMHLTKAIDILVFNLYAFMFQWVSELLANVFFFIKIDL